MLNLSAVHHIAIICQDYQKSKRFYTEILGLTVLSEVNRAERQSYKLRSGAEWAVRYRAIFISKSTQTSIRPEALGLRHLAFAVADLDASVAYLTKHDVVTEPIRVDELTGKRFTFFADPDDLPLELYEA